MPPRLKAELKEEEIIRIRQAIADGTAHSEIPMPTMQIYLEKYAHREVDEYENALEMEIIPEHSIQHSSNMQKINPMDDVIQDDSPPCVEEYAEGYTDEVYLKMYQQGLLSQGDDPYLDKLLEETQTETENNVQQEQISSWMEAPLSVNDANHEEAFLEAAFNPRIAEGDSQVKPVEQQREIVAEAPKRRGRPPKKIVEDTAPTEQKVVSLKEIVAGPIKSTPNVNEAVSTDCKEKPKYGEANWTQYVLSLLDLESEEFYYDDKGKIRPRYQGLKRLCELLIGPIVETKSDIVVTPTVENGGNYTVRATVKVIITNPDHPAYTRVIDPQDSVVLHPVKWADYGNVFADDENRIKRLNPTTSAYTMALSRCLRNILGLVGVYTSEEMEDKGQPNTAYNHDTQGMQKLSTIPGSIQERQTRFILSAEEYGADWRKIAEEVIGSPVNVLQKLSSAEASLVQKRVSALQFEECPEKWKL